MKKNKKENKVIEMVIGILILVLISCLIIIPNITEKKENKNKDKEITEKKFIDEYPEVGEDNVFEIKTIDDIIKILEHGTGLVYLGFPECPWCQEYVLYLNEVAKEEKLEKIYYFNILKDRKENTKEYQKIVKLISDYLQYDEEGNKRIYVPALIAVDRGKVVGFDDETAWDTKGYEDPKDYWTTDEVDDLKDKLEEMIEQITPNTCTDCNK